jgi:hypothetical protein
MFAGGRFVQLAFAHVRRAFILIVPKIATTAAFTARLPRLWKEVKGDLFNLIKKFLFWFGLSLLTLILIGVLYYHGSSISEVSSLLWSKYVRNRDNLAPLLTPIVAAFAGAIALMQVWVAWRRHQEQTFADRQRRITESYSKAVEQLGSEKVEVRLGGIYTLERISNESPNDYWTVMETLTAFVREHANQSEPNAALTENVTPLCERTDGQPAQPKQRRPTEIAAVLTVIKRRKWEYQQELELRKGWEIDLRNTDLEGANFVINRLYGAHFEGANLSHANLGLAVLVDAHLEGANLAGAHLESANLTGAHLEGANLAGAHLEGANLQDATGVARIFRLFSATANARTRLPAGVPRPRHWPPEAL